MPLTDYPEEFQKVLLEYNRDLSVPMRLLKKGAWSATEWQEEMEKLIAQYSQFAWRAGAESVGNIPPGSLELIHDRVQEQLKYLGGFAAVIQAAGGKYDPAWEARVQMYGAATVVEYWEGKTQGLPLPAMPGQGTQCLGNCHCQWDIHWINEANGDADCYWKLGAAEHCQTCLTRAEQWNPVYIRGGDLWGSEANPPVALPPKPTPSSRYGVGEAPPSRRADEAVQEWIRKSDESGTALTPSELKNKICTEIAQRAGLSYDKVAESIREWANTSNDSSFRALYMQERVSKLFGVPLSKWQRSRLQEVGSWARSNNESTIMNEHDTDLFLRAMYENTQDQFAAAGIKTVTLYRGASLLADDVQGWHQGSTVSISTNAMSSWTSDPAVAARFSASGNYEVVLAMRVPVTRVIGTARSGFGCYDEQEFVLLGYDGDQAYVHSIKDGGASLQ